MEERYDENMEERAIEEVEYDRAVDYDYQVERNNMVEQYEIDRQIDRVQDNYVENQYLVDREVQQEVILHLRSKGSRKTGSSRMPPTTNTRPRRTQK